MRMNRMILHLAVGALVLGAPSPRLAAAPAPTYGTFGIDTAGMDRSVAPGDDFFRFVNGTYVKNLVIPEDKPSYGMFHRLHELSQTRTRVLVEAAAAARNARPGSEEQKVGDFYASFLDEAAIEARGLAPLKPYLDAIAGIGDRSALARAFGQGMRVGLDTALSLDPDQDLKHPDRMSVYVNQGGLGLPDREYYRDLKNPAFVRIRRQYQDHLAAMLALAGLDRARARAEAIYALEAKLAEVQWSKADLRQVDRTYNPVQAGALAGAYPGIDWTALFAGAGVPAQAELIIASPSAILGTGRLMAGEPLEAWRDYLTYHLLTRAASLLPRAFSEEDFAFRGKVLSGQPQDQPRWKRGVDATTDALGEAVGKLYVARYFPPEAKAQADVLVKNVIAAMDQRLSRLTWMDPATKAKARAKLAVFTPKIGYPDHWRDYGRLEIRRGDALGNGIRAAEFRYQREVDKLGKPIDRSEWGMTPMTVNAYANPAWNEIVFPAAILQPPFFDPNADPAVNYGGIGAVIGHEISHHFDDQGRKYDLTGKVAQWWTAEDVRRFTALTDQVVKQYGAYEPLKGSHVNGELTLGENMADLAGLNVAFDAYHQSLGGKPDRVIDGFTGDQRFFMGFAQVWRTKYRDAALLKQITTNEHTPGTYRPNVVRDLDGWYEAFNVKPGQALYLAPGDRIKVW